MCFICARNSELAGEAGVVSPRQRKREGEGDGVNVGKPTPEKGVSCTLPGCRSYKIRVSATPQSMHCWGPGLCRSFSGLGLFLREDWSHRRTLSSGVHI